MKNHIIFWNRGKAITLALLASLALSLSGYAADEYGDVENKDNSDPSKKSTPVYYAWEKDLSGHVTGYEKVDTYESCDFVWYSNNTREEKTESDKVTKDTELIEGNYRNIIKDSSDAPVTNYKKSIESIIGDFEKNKITATSGHGAAIYNREDSSIGNIQASFVENKSATEGGAIGNYKADITTIANSLFLGNTANGAQGGGAIYNYQKSIETIENSTFIGNQAANYDTTKNTSNGIGGAIRNRDTATIDKISGSNFYANYASKSGGAIYNDGNGTITEIISVLNGDGNEFSWNLAE